MGNAMQKPTEKHVKETDSTALMEPEWKVAGGMVRWATPACPQTGPSPILQKLPSKGRTHHKGGQTAYRSWG